MITEANTPKLDDVKLNNQLIAEFMWKLCICDDETPHYKYGSGNWEVYYIGDLRFHLSWEWLMPVVEKIYKTITFTPYYSKDPKGIDISIYPNFCSFHLPDTNEGYDYTGDCYYNPPLYSHSVTGKPTIECVYECCVDFIRWYNIKECPENSISN